MLLAAGCTVIPRVVQDSTPSFDGNQQNSGLIDFDPAGRGIITPHARDRYNALIEKYGPRFSPALQRDAWITPTATNTFLLDAQGMVDFGTMNRWRKQER